MLKIFPNIEELNNFAAQKFVEIADKSKQFRKSVTVALAGGSTPKALYRLLASEKFRDKVDWNRVHFFFGDERNVLPDNAESNFRMAKENLFEPLKINDTNIFRWETELENTEMTAFYYDIRVSSFFCTVPRFDLVLLGMGADGHTASLFPFTDALRETERNAVENYVEKLQTTRLTLTFPVINNAKNIMFLVAGEDKAETLKAVLEGEFEPEKLPSQNVQPKDGELYWLLDENVAKLLGKDGN